ncbi:hypothetical protein L2U69_12025 [Zavarzinia compransoris]|uniref:hypothetical protein n=1 Tax=Zavarzinia marina TaxID=2911065 RepID=UPI001F21DC10|nr:hypothetical protein [Zavarzinia marina]MCF4166374.1 hypothetical protein [Zavarzinia marina]
MDEVKIPAAAIEAAAKAIWESADDEIGWDATLLLPAMSQQVEFVREEAHAAISAALPHFPGYQEPILSAVERIFREHGLAVPSDATMRIALAAGVAVMTSLSERHDRVYDDGYAAGQESMRTDLRLVLANLRWLEECTGETLEGEDATVVRQIEADLDGANLDRDPDDDAQPLTEAEALKVARNALIHARDNLTPHPDQMLDEALAKIDAVAGHVGSPCPIPMILHCPFCHQQHIDAPSPGWNNPSHRSHLCSCCGTIWRPADVPTTGVFAIKTKGTADRMIDARRPIAELEAGAENARLIDALTKIERVYWIEGKEDGWRATKMRALASEALAQINALLGGEGE